MIGARVKFEAFAGRSAELAFLRDRLVQAARGEGSCTLIIGEMGLGKSRLVAEFRKAVAPETARFAEWVCSTDSPTTLHRLLRGLVNTVPPQVLIIEDLHEADQTTTHLVQQSIQRAGALPVYFLVTCRSERMRTEPRIGAMLSSLLRHGARAIYLEPLAQPDVRFLLKPFADGEAALSALEIERIEELADGNPFYLEELLRDTLDRQEAGRAAFGERIPHALEAAVLECLKPLAPSTRRILRAAAILGNEFELQLLSQCSSHGFSDILDAVQHGLDARLITEASPEDRYRFRHPLVRAVLYAQVATPAAIALHISAAQALEKCSGRSERLTELAYHWAAGRDPVMAQRYNEEAGDAAMLTYDYHDAARFFQIAVRFAPSSHAGLAELNGKVAYALYCDGRLDEAKPYFRAAIDRHLEAASLKAAFRLIDLLFTVYWYDGDTKGGLAFAAWAFGVARLHSERGFKDQLLVRTAGYLNVLGKSTEVETLLRRVGKSERHLEVLSRTELHQLRAITLTRSGRFQQAIHEFELALDISRADPTHRATTKIAGNLATCYRLMGDLDTAERLARDALDWTDARHLSLTHRCGRAIEYAEVLFLRGRLQEAARITRRIFTSVTALNGMMFLKAASIAIPIAIATMRDDLLSYCDDDSILARAFATRTLAYIATLTDAFALLYLHRGRRDDAQALLHRAMASATAPDPFALDMLICVAKHGAAEDLPKAHQLLLDICELRPPLISQAYVSYFGAVMAQRERSWSRRRRLADASAAGFAELGMPMYEANTLELAGRQREARAIYQRIGAAADATRLARVFAARGARGGTLTQRQREIGELVVSGASNREMARRLRITEKTLANHLTDIYRRLDIDSRGALVTYLSEQLGITS